MTISEAIRDNEKMLKERDKQARELADKLLEIHDLKCKLSEIIEKYPL